MNSRFQRFEQVSLVHFPYPPEKTMRDQSLNYDTNKAGDASGVRCTKAESRTIQSAAEDCDINVIVKRMGLGQAAPITAKLPMQGDFTEVADYRDALHLVRAADEAFMQLPAATRFRFDNDPAKLLEFIDDPNNAKEAVTLGLAVLRTPPADPAPKAPPDEPKK